MPAGLRGRDEKMNWGDLAGMASLPAKSFQFKALAAAVQLFTGRYIVVGVSFANPGASGGLVTLYDGQDDNGVVVYTQGVGAAQSFTTPIGVNGVLVENGIYIDPSGGTITGAVWAVPLWTYNITAPGT